MKMQPLCSLLLPLLLVFGAFPVLAGEPALELLPDSLREKHQDAGDPLPLNDWSRLQRIPAGTELRISLEGARVVQGRLVSATDERLTLRISAKEVSTEASSKVVRVHRVIRDPILNGSLIGFGAGAGVGALLGALPVPSPLTPLDPDEHSRGAFVATGILIGGGVGAALGALVDHSEKQFEVIYER